MLDYCGFLAGSNQVETNFRFCNFNKRASLARHEGKILILWVNNFQFSSEFALEVKNIFSFAMPVGDMP